MCGVLYNNNKQDNIISQQIFAVNEIFKAMMNICIALFCISLELITYIFIQLQRYLEYAEIFTSFFIHIYLGQCEIIHRSLFTN